MVQALGRGGQAYHGITLMSTFIMFTSVSWKTVPPCRPFGPWPGDRGRLEDDQLAPAREYDGEIHHEQHQVIVPTVRPVAPKTRLPHEDLLLYRAEHDQDQTDGGELRQDSQSHAGAAEQLRRPEKQREARARADAARAGHRI